MFTVIGSLTYNCVLQLLYNCVFIRYSDSTDLKKKLMIRDHLGILLRRNVFCFVVFLSLSVPVTTWVYFCVVMPFSFCCFLIPLCTRDNLGILLRRNAYFVLLFFISLCTRDNLGLLLRRNAVFVLLFFISLFIVHLLLLQTSPQRLVRWQKTFKRYGVVIHEKYAVKFLETFLNSFDLNPFIITRIISHPCSL